MKYLGLAHISVCSDYRYRHLLYFVASVCSGRRHRYLSDFEGKSVELELSDLRRYMVCSECHRRWFSYLVRKWMESKVSELPRNIVCTECCKYFPYLVGQLIECEVSLMTC